MDVPQSGIFALGTPAHAYLEFDAIPGTSPAALVAAVASFADAQTMASGSEVVVGFRGLGAAKSEASKKVFAEIETMLDGLVKEATK